MNQVTEMLQLGPDASESEAIARLSKLFATMVGARGFRNVELLRRLDEPGLLLVLHTWDNIEDWQAFQSSDVKIGFSASRPANLYRFLPCGMNWLLQEGAGAGIDGAFLRREVLHETAVPSSGPDVVSSQTFAYQDYEPSLVGTTLRLTRLRAVPDPARVTSEGVVADEVYESVHHRAATREQYEVAG